MTTEPEHLDESLSPRRKKEEPPPTAPSLVIPPIVNEDGETTARENARRRVERKHKLRGDFVAYVVVNSFLIFVWAFTGFGYFWPGWVLGGWGVLLMLDAWNTYYRGPVTDHEVEQEIRRGQ